VFKDMYINICIYTHISTYKSSIVGCFLYIHFRYLQILFS
jgi:hypothetical protein